MSNNLYVYMRTNLAMPTLFVATLYCLFFLSCKKDDNNPGNNPNEIREHYQPAATLTAGQPVMYTGTGAITDQAVIRAYLTRRDALSHFALDRTTIPGDNYSSFTLDFKESNRVQLGFRKAEIIENDDNLLLIAEIDSSVSRLVGNQQTDRLISLVPVHSPRTVCSDYYNTPCKYREICPVIISNGNYSIPYVTAYVSVDEVVSTPWGMAPQTIYKSTSGIMLFNKDMVSELNEGGGINRADTLVVQLLKRQMIKK